MFTNFKFGTYEAEHSSSDFMLIFTVKFVINKVFIKRDKI